MLEIMLAYYANEGKSAPLNFLMPLCHLSGLFIALER